VYLTLAVDFGVRCWRAAVTDVLAVEVVVRVPMQVFLVAAADKVTARHDALLYATFAATFNNHNAKQRQIKSNMFG